jgi:hypothetical protein
MTVTIQLSLSPPSGHAYSCLYYWLRDHMITREHRIVMKQLDHLSLVQTNYEHPSRAVRIARGRGMLMSAVTRRRGQAPGGGLAVIGRRRDKSEVQLQGCIVVTYYGVVVTA